MSICPWVLVPEPTTTVITSVGSLYVLADYVVDDYVVGDAGTVEEIPFVQVWALIADAPRVCA